MNIGNRIREWRDRRGLTQDELAERADISQSYVVKIEKNNTDPSMKVIKKIAEVLNIPVSFLIEKDIDSFGEAVSYAELDEETQEFLKDLGSNKGYIVLAKNIKKANLEPEYVEKVMEAIAEYKTKNKD